MNKKYLLILTILTLVVISSCGPAPTPSLSVADLQGTAIADAWAAVTLTQAALPTATATFTLSPTETPTATFAVFPTIPPLQPTLAVPAGSPTLDPCNDVPPKKPKGTTVNVKFVNKSEASADLYFGMNYPNALGECGTYHIPMGKFDRPVVTVLAGCYWAYAYVYGNKPSNAKSVDALCVTDPAREPDIWVGTETINFH